MTITLQAVNELIKSLKSAGELSIKETKVMALAKAYQQLAVENAALKQFPEQIVKFIGGLGTSEMGSETKEKIELAANRIKTPATEAVLAELRNEAGARAVELFAKTLGSPYRFRDEKCYEDGFTRAIEIVRDAQAPRFAKQLREGAK